MSPVVIPPSSIQRWRLCSRSPAALLHSIRSDLDLRSPPSSVVINLFSPPLGSDLLSRLSNLFEIDFMLNRLVSKFSPFPGMKHLDVAGGTGDVAFRILETVNSVNRRAIADTLEDDLQRTEKLNFEDNSMDGYTIAFGIRNVTHIEKVLAEAYRVLKKGGRFICLELSHVEAPVFKQVYDYYSFSVIPVLGELVAGDRGVCFNDCGCCCDADLVNLSRFEVFVVLFWFRFSVEPSRAREAHTFHELELELEIEARGELKPSFELEYISRARA
ncbi:hypothetical protein LXL04_038645 [Taraxacum kok-saghyz]